MINMVIGSAVLSRALQKIGSWININIGSLTINEYGDGSVTFVDSEADWGFYSGEGYIFHRTDIDTSAFPGILNEADAIGYFTMSSPFPYGSKIEITFRGDTYETLGEPVVPPFSGNDLLQIINLRKKVN